MTSSSAMTSYFPPPPDHLSSVSIHQTKTYDWSESRELREGSESQDRTPPKDNSTTPPGRISVGGMQKMPFSPSPLVMPNQNNVEAIKSNPKSAAPLEPYVRDGLTDDTLTNISRRVVNRWSFNGSEKLLDPKANWNLVEEIGKLKIAGSDDGLDGSSTPPKNIVREVVHVQDTSPLETSSSEASLGSSSPQNVDGLNPSSHSRGSSTDTMNSESSARSQMLNPLKTSQYSADLTKDRPRSFSGAISDAELRRLQNITTPSQLPESFQDRGASPLTRDANGAESKTLSSTPNGENLAGQSQPMFPSLLGHPNGHQPMNGLSAQGFSQGFVGRGDELQVDHSIQPRQFVGGAHVPGVPFNQAQAHANGMMRSMPPDAMNFRQPVRGMNMFQSPMQHPAQVPQTLLPSPTNFAYSNLPNNHGHPNHLSLGSSQQLYDMMIPPVDPAVSRAQQTFRGGHQHSASDPASLRDAAQMLLNAGYTGMQQFQPNPGMNPAMYPPMPIASPPVYANQFFPGASPQPQGMYSQEMMPGVGRAMPQYGANGNPTTPTANQTSFNSTPSPQNSTGPSANNRKLGLYKTELCRSWEEKGTCRYGPKCQFAHGEDEIKKVARHPKYKTEICRTFWVSGSCPYGKRCCFIHTELPANGQPPAAQANSDGTNNTPPAVDGRARSMSTNSDPNDSQQSLLARITAKRTSKDDPSGSNAVTPTATSVMENGNFQYGQKPPTGALRVDTTVAGDAVTAAKQNKSAYPSFANSAPQALSPGPVTAGPEFVSRAFGSRGVGVDLNQRMSNVANQNSNPRHSYTGSDASLNFGQQNRNVSGGSSPFGMLQSQVESPGSSGTPGGHAHGHGHSRSGSASNWGSFGQAGHLAGAYVHTPSPANEMGGVSSPWGNQDPSHGSTRLNDRTWS